MNLLDLPPEIIFKIIDIVGYNEIYPISGLISKRFVNLFNAYLDCREKRLEVDKTSDVFNSMKNGIIVKDLVINKHIVSETIHIKNILKIDVIEKLTIIDHIGHEYMKEISEGLEGNDKCKHLSLKRFSGGSIDLLCNRLDNIVYLSMCNNFLDDYSVYMLCKNISRESPLKYLKLSNNRIKDDGVYHISLILYKLLELDISSNVISSTGCSCIADRIDSIKLVTLDISSNFIHYAGISRLLRAFQLNKTLKNLKLASNYLHINYYPNTDSNIFTILGDNKSIENLNLKACELNFDKDVSDMLSNNSTLRKLDLSANYKDRFYHISSGLLKNKSITDIRLRNVLKNEDVSTLVNVIKVNKTIKNMDILENNFKVKSISSIFDALKDNKTLESIMVSWENCSYNNAFLEHIKTNSYEKINSRDFVSIGACLSESKSLKRVILEVRTFGPSGYHIYKYNNISVSLYINLLKKDLFRCCRNLYLAGGEI